MILRCSIHPNQADQAAVIGHIHAKQFLTGFLRFTWTPLAAQGVQTFGPRPATPLKEKPRDAII